MNYAINKGTGIFGEPCIWLSGEAVYEGDLLTEDCPEDADISDSVETRYPIYLVDGTKLTDDYDLGQFIDQLELCGYTTDRAGNDMRLKEMQE